MATILLLNDTSDHNNWGSIAGAEALKSIISKSCPGSRIESINSRWTTSHFRRLPASLGGAVYCRSNKILNRLSKPFLFTPSVVDDFELVADEWLSGRGGAATREVLEKLNDADLVVFHAEGATYRNNESAIRCLFTLWLAKTRLGIPALFLNGSVTLTEVDPVLPAMVAKTFTAIDGVAVREPFSHRNVRRWVPNIDVELIPDAVFFFSPVQLDEASPEIRRTLQRFEKDDFFCVSLSMLQPMQPGYMRFGVENSAMFALIEALKGLRMQPVLLARDVEDQRIMRDLARATDSVFLGPEFHFRDIQAVLSRASFLISGRFHHLILAAISGCPGIPLRTSSHKVDGLNELLNERGSKVFDPTDLWPNIDAIVDRAREILEDRDARTRIASRASTFRSQVERLGEMVRDVL